VRLIHHVVPSSIEKPVIFFADSSIFHEAKFHLFGPLVCTLSSLLRIEPVAGRGDIQKIHVGAGLHGILHHLENRLPDTLQAVTLQPAGPA